ncbi:MAG: class II glutamine amidotransferase [Acidiferrobacter sp.]
MCELMGVSASAVFDVRPWLQRFRPRGGDTANNPDGWGLAWIRDGHFVLNKEPTAGARSALFAGLCATVQSSLIVGHVRHAKYPRINNLENTHPFLRQCCDRQWVFAHNGLVANMMSMANAPLRGTCAPQGETDSEYAFCYLLEHIALQMQHNTRDGGDSWFSDLASIVELITTYGKFNFLISDGDYLIAYGHDRLHYRDIGTLDLPAVVIVTEPLSAEEWCAFLPGELRIYRHGRLMANWQTHAAHINADQNAALESAREAPLPEDGSPSLDASFAAHPR